MPRTYVLSLSTLTLAALLAGGCAKKSPDATLAAAPPAGPVTATTDAAAATTTTEQAVARVVANLERIHFAYDSEQLVGDSLAALTDNARILAAHPEIKVEIQGHADARGTTEYNLALGQRRADAVVAYLVRSAVPETQVRSVSFGKEKPLDARQSEEAWAQNRRVEFRVTAASPVASVVGTVE